MAITVQTNYDFSAGPTGPGVLDDGERNNVCSRTVDETGANFGQACFEISEGIVSALPGGANGQASGVFLGVAVSNVGEASWMNAVPQSDVYAARSNVSVLTKGSIWVLAGSAVTIDAPAYVTPQGAFTAVAAGNTPIRASFRNDGPQASLVRLRVY